MLVLQLLHAPLAVPSVRTPHALLAHHVLQGADPRRAHLGQQPFIVQREESREDLFLGKVSASTHNHHRQAGLAPVVALKMVQLLPGQLQRARVSTTQSTDHMCMQGPWHKPSASSQTYRVGPKSILSVLLCHPVLSWCIKPARHRRLGTCRPRWRINQLGTHLKHMHKTY